MAHHARSANAPPSRRQERQTEPFTHRQRCGRSAAPELARRAIGRERPLTRSRARKRSARSKSRRRVLSRLTAALGLMLLLGFASIGALWFWAERSGPGGDPLPLTL